MTLSLIEFSFLGQRNNPFLRDPGKSPLNYQYEIPKEADYIVYYELQAYAQMHWITPRTIAKVYVQRIPATSRSMKSKSEMIRDLLS